MAQSNVRDGPDFLTESFDEKMDRDSVLDKFHSRFAWCEKDYLEDWLNYKEIDYTRKLYRCIAT